MSDDRNQAPGKRRLKLARERGHVAHSPEFTSALGWLSGLAALAALGPGLGAALVELMKRAITLADTAQAEDAPAWFGRIALQLGGRLAVIVAAHALGATVAHLIQTRGLVTQSRLAPDPKRLWAFRTGRGSFLERISRALWSGVRGLVVMAVVGAWMRASWPALVGLATLRIGPMTSAFGALAAHLAATLAGTAMVLGALDYGLRRRGLLARLKTTREEQREEHRRMEGDTAGRGNRRRLARSRQGGAVERAAAGEPA